MQTLVTKIVQFLTRHGKPFTCHDLPYEVMDAELQDWGFTKPGNMMLIIGYWQEQDGELIPDPNFVIDLQDGQIAAVRVQTCDERVTTGSEAAEYAAEILPVIYERHLHSREREP